MLSGIDSSARLSTRTPAGMPTTPPAPVRRAVSNTIGVAPAADVSVEIANESGDDVDERALLARARHVLTEMDVHPLAELSVLLVDPATMERLHRRYMDESGPTDVLA